MRVLFMGTPEIAATVLEALAKEQQIVGVFCQPDKPVGRKAVITPPPVKVLAERLGIPVFQPTKMRDGTAAAAIRELRPDAIAVVAYGRILPPDILAIPPRGCINLHASLLPKYRGAAPVQYALLCGETETGVTAMYMDEGLDTGDIIAQATCPVLPEDDAETLFRRVGAVGAPLLCSTLRDIEAGSVRRTKQNDAQATFAPPFTRETGAFTWSAPARDIVNKARALSVWPNAYFERDGKKIKLMKARLADAAGEPGEVLATAPLTVAAGEGAVELLEVRPEGSRQMTGKEWAAGLRIGRGGRL